MIAPVRRPGRHNVVNTSRTARSAEATRHSASGRITSFTLVSLRPKLPPGWNFTKSRGLNSRMRAITSASASPNASMAVVEVLGASPNEQASRIGPRSSTTLALRANVLPVLPVMATIGTPNSITEGSIRSTSSVSPLNESTSRQSSR